MNPSIAIEQDQDNVQNNILNPESAPSELDESNDDEIVTHSSSKPWYQRPSPIWIFIPQALSCLIQGIILAPKIQFITLLICYEHYSETMLPELGSGEETNDTYMRCSKNTQIVQAVSFLNTSMIIILNILGVITASKLGTLSDRRGRKWVLFIVMTASLLEDLVIIFTNFAYRIVTSKFLIIGSILRGLAGGMAGSTAITHAYVADCSKPADRAILYGILTAEFFGGLALGPILGGWIIKWSGQVITVFYISVAVHTLYALWIPLVLPESLAKEKRDTIKRQTSEFNASQRNTFGGNLRWLINHILEPLIVFAPRSKSNHNNIIEDQNDENTANMTLHIKEHPLERWNLTFVSMSFGMMVFSLGLISVLIQYLAYVFDEWDEVDNGQLLSLMGISRTLVYLVLLPVIVKTYNHFAERKRRRKHDREMQLQTDTSSISPLIDFKQHSQTLDIWIVRVSLFIDTIAYLSMALSVKKSQFFSSSVFAALGAAALPGLQSLLTTMVPPLQVGRVLAGMATLQSIIGVISPMIATWIFTWTLETFPSAIFYYATSMLGAATIVSFCIRPHSKKTRNDIQENSNNNVTERTPLLPESNE